MHQKRILPVAAVLLAAIAAPVVLDITRSDRGPALADARTDALSLYVQAERLLSQDKPDAAAKKLADAPKLPLFLSENVTSSGPRQDIHGPSLLVSITRGVSDEAMAAAYTGDRRAALAWVARVRGMAAHALATPQPTLVALLTARALDVNAARLELRVLNRLKDTAEAAKAAKRLEVWRAFEQDEVMSRVQEARLRRTDIVEDIFQRLHGGEKEAALRQADRALLKVENRLAGDLIPLYREGRARFLLSA